MNNWAPLRAEVGHTYEDVKRFLNPERENWGRELLESFWSDDDLREGLGNVALIDLLFESANRSTLYGFFAVSKRLCPKGGKSQERTYQDTLNSLFNNKKVTVGSHSVFREGLPNTLNEEMKTILLETHEELEVVRKIGGIFSENYLHGQINICAKPLSALGTIEKSSDLFDYGEIRADSPLSDARKFKELKEESSRGRIIKHWKEFLNDFQLAFNDPHCGDSFRINMFAVPILTRDDTADEKATGALFFGQFAK